MKKVLSYSAMAALLVFMVTGCGKTDESKAAKAYTKAWELRLEKKHAESLKKFEEAANLGHVGAQVYIASMYYCGYGEGVGQDLTKAAYWYKKAADAPKEKASSYAMYKYAEMCRNGKGVARSDAEAEKYYKMADQLNYSLASYQLGVYAKNSKKYVEAIEFFTKASDLGCSDAQFALSEMYEKAEFETSIDAYLKKHDKKALNKEEKLDASQKLMLKAADQKHVGALKDVYAMAQSRERDDDARLPKDMKRAVELYSKAAEKGHMESQYRLGQLSEIGVKNGEETILAKDEDNAEKWYGKAAEQGHKGGLKKVCEIAEKYIKNGKKNLGIAWYKRAEKLKYAPAIEALKKLGARGKR